jgi:uncharacterized membrane protein YfcA
MCDHPPATMNDLAALLGSPLSELDSLRLTLILLAIFGGGAVKGAIGFGFPLVTVPLVSALWDARHAVLLISFASLTNNVGVVARGGGSRTTSRRFVLLAGGLMVGTVGGALLLAVVPASTLSLVVGSAALTFSSLGLLKPDLAMPPHLERYLALPLGVLGGLLGGSTTISGPFIASYTHALKLSKREFVFFLSLMYLVGATIQTASYAALGLFDAPTVILSVASCLPNLLGVWLGLRVQDRIDQQVFRTLVVVMIGFSGVALLVRGLWS